MTNFAVIVPFDKLRVTRQHVILGNDFGEMNFLLCKKFISPKSLLHMSYEMSS